MCSREWWVAAILRARTSLARQEVRPAGGDGVALLALNPLAFGTNDPPPARPVAAAQSSAR
jgi:hypothetical protein